jgi:hypothetical protein
MSTKQLHAFLHVEQGNLDCSPAVLLTAVATSPIRVVNRIVPQPLIRGEWSRRRSIVPGKTLSKTRSQFPLSISSSQRGIVIRLRYVWMIDKAEETAEPLEQLFDGGHRDPDNFFASKCQLCP